MSHCAALRSAVIPLGISLNLSVGLALALSSAGCGGPPSPAAPTPAAAQSVPSEAEGLARRLLALTPNEARALGLHEFDGRIGDFSAAGVQHRIAALRELDAAVTTLST